MAQAPAKNRVLVAEMLLDARVGGREGLFTYALDAPAAPGEAFLAPLGARAVVAYVYRCFEADEEELGFPFSKLRPVGARIDGLSLPEPLMRLIEHTAQEYLSPPSIVLGAAVPPGVLGRLATLWELEPDRLRETPFELNAVQQEVVKALEDSGGTLEQTRGGRLRPAIVAALKSLRAKGVVRQEFRVDRAAEKRDVPEMLRLTPDSDRIDTFLRKSAKKKPAQAVTLLRLMELDHPTLTPSDIKGLAGVTDATVKSLIDAKLLERVDPARKPVARSVEPNPAQRIAIDALGEAIAAREPRGFLLYGVTGSGKTEVYLRAAAEALRLGRQTLYLVPEIALATQAVSSLRERFGDRVAVLHSDLAPRDRLDNWMAVRNGEAAVVIGARSALFAPLREIGLIVVDEEHEGGYKQDASPRYHARGLAEFLSRQHRCPVVYGSATPSVESFYAAETSRLTLMTLPERAASARLPEVQIEDLGVSFREGKPTLFSEALVEALTETLSRGEQAILFLNRRAYAPFLICRDCGHTFKCPSCAVSLAYSRRLNRLRCHHCDFRTVPPGACPKCQGSRVRAFGVGTEKVEEAVAEQFPGIAVARLDRDVAQKRGALEKVLASFASGETRVLVGTQMVAKGLNFPNVTLVGVIAADVSLNIPDFRSTERTFQLLSQVAGRSGRGTSPGRVIIQTFNPENGAILAARDHDYSGFYENAKNDREEAGYPPFRRLVNVILAGEDRGAVTRASEHALDMLQGGVPDADVLGPADCALERLHGRWRRHLLVKLQPGATAAPVGSALSDFDPKGVQIVIDVDPYSLM